VHRADDARVAAAAARAWIQRRGDLPVGRIGVDGQQGRGAQRHAGRAVPALRRSFGDQRALNRVQRLTRQVGQALDRGDRTVGYLAGPQLAGQFRLAVDKHRAGATRALAATNFDPGQAQLGPQPRQQAGIRPADLAGLAVDDGATHACDPRGRGLRRAA
jgi:hypothetical protein